MPVQGIPQGHLSRGIMSEFNNQNPEIPDDLSSLDATESLQPEDEVEAQPEQSAPSAEDMVEQLTAQRDEYLRSLQQTAADFDNYRKRVTRQSLEVGDQKVEALIVRLLPALDNIELALAHSGENPELTSSLAQISNSLFDILAKEGLEQINIADVDFDPTCHEAVIHEPGEGRAKVTEVLRTGYRWKQKVVRPAMVKVVGQG